MGCLRRPRLHSGRTISFDLSKPYRPILDIHPRGIVGRLHRPSRDLLPSFQHPTRVQVDRSNVVVRNLGFEEARGGSHHHLLFRNRRPNLTSPENKPFLVAVNSLSQPFIPGGPKPPESLYNLTQVPKESDAFGWRFPGAFPSSSYQEIRPVRGFHLLAQNTSTVLGLFVVSTRLFTTCSQQPFSLSRLQ